MKVYRAFQENLKCPLEIKVWYHQKAIVENSKLKEPGSQRSDLLGFSIGFFLSLGCTFSQTLSCATHDKPHLLHNTLHDTEEFGRLEVGENGSLDCIVAGRITGNHYSLACEDLCFLCQPYQRNHVTSQFSSLTLKQSALNMLKVLCIVQNREKCIG